MIRGIWYTLENTKYQFHKQFNEQFDPSENIALILSYHIQVANKLLSSDYWKQKNRAAHFISLLFYLQVFSTVNFFGLKLLFCHNRHSEKGQVLQNYVNWTRRITLDDLKLQSTLVWSFLCLCSMIRTPQLNNEPKKRTILKYYIYKDSPS